ncbi:MAG: carbon monoxide dehydrogenase subunit G [Chloroflexi bacterium]|nr:carbon monoxide dehydrogenase subunit G [Chloroflexota bacterium]
MRLTGSRTIQAPPEAIQAFLTTPEKLRRCLPGCERFVADGPDRFSATLSLGVAFLKGTYTGTIQIVDQQFPEHLALAVQGGGSLGSLMAQGVLRFSSSGAATLVTYDGTAWVTGRVAVLGEPLLHATAQRLFGRFFDCLASHVER